MLQAYCLSLKSRRFSSTSCSLKWSNKMRHLSKKVGGHLCSDNHCFPRIGTKIRKAMRVTSHILLGLLFLYAPTLHAQSKGKVSATKSRAIQYIDRRQKELTAWSNEVWEYAEPSLEEVRSSELLIRIFKEEGFVVQENVSGFPTVFIASYGNTGPVIGLFGEYDADPNASNKVVPRREELIKNGYGHGGHHNLLGVGSLGAALAIRELIKTGKLNCSIRYYGTTAEGSTGTKTYLARDGYFNDLDLSLYWHPAPVTWASTGTWDALIDFDITLRTQRINIIQEIPSEKNTLQALELLLQKINRLRQQMDTGRRINYVLHEKNTDLNYIPDTIRITLRIQCARQEDALTFFNQLKNDVGEVSATTGVTSEVNVSRAMHQFMPNLAAMRLAHRNMELLGPIQYSEEEQAFAKELQAFLHIPQEGIQDQVPSFSDQSKRDKLYGYASDIGDASWIAPEVYFVVRTLPGVPMHQWPGTLFSGHSIGHKGMIQASKLITMTVIDFVENESVREEIRKEFEANRKAYRYQSLLGNQEK